ncbi:substrate-binding domain-containing protein [Arthrobacter sp. B0490]|uniref:sugar ABC transporter substrate-binding protein n=1 Tax=Arthrobacter sp. B0490 TaxID=2058891 RepID=UPI000CE30608|nr:substrate-binding domain-containing protein [Arthrobacter sp. B0490]
MNQPATKSNRSRARLLVGTVTIAAMLALAGCGSGGGGNADGGTSPNPTAGSNAALDEVLNEEIELPLPQEPTTVGGDRQITYIIGGQGAGGASEVAAERKTIIEKAGWTVDGPLDGKFTPSTQATLIEKAVLSGVDAIVLDFIYPSQVAGAIDSARAADIPVICNQCMPEKSSDGVYMIGTDVELVAEQQTRFVLAALDKPDATIVVGVDSGQAIVKAWQEALIPMLKEECPGCEIVEIPFTAADIGKPVAPSLVNMLSQYPPGQLDAYIAPFGPAVTSLLGLAEQAGRDDFKIIDTYGDAPVSTWIKNGEHSPLMYGSTLISQSLLSYGDVDTLARIFNGQPITDFSTVPVAVIAAENADKFVADNGRWQPDGLEDTFQELWGITG